MRARFTPMVTTLATPPATVFETDIRSLQRLHKGKVRDVYAIDDSFAQDYKFDVAKAFRPL